MNYAEEEAVANIREAARGNVAALEEDHIPVPEEHLMRRFVAA